MQRRARSAPLQRRTKLCESPVSSCGSNDPSGKKVFTMEEEYVSGEYLNWSDFGSLLNGTDQQAGSVTDGVFMRQSVSVNDGRASKRCRSGPSSPPSDNGSETGFAANQNALIVQTGDKIVQTGDKIVQSAKSLVKAMELLTIATNNSNSQASSHGTSAVAINNNNNQASSRGTSVNEADSSGVVLDCLNDAKSRVKMSFQAEVRALSYFSRPENRRAYWELEDKTKVGFIKYEFKLLRSEKRRGVKIGKKRI